MSEFVARSGCSGVDATPHHRRRDVADALRTVYWYAGVQQRVRISSARGLEWRFEPDSFWFSPGKERMRRNKWGKYRAGQHVPSETLVLKVEAECPGSRRELNHPLWRLLASGKWVDTGFEDELAQLDWQVQEVMRRRSLRPPVLKRGFEPIDRRLACSLERRASLDSLAALILLLRRAHAAGRAEEVAAWSRRIYRMLTILGYELLIRKVALPLFELVEKRVLCLQSEDAAWYWQPSSHYIRTIGALLDAMHHLKGVSYAALSPGQKNFYMQKVLDGKYGWDYKFAFDPVWIKSVDEMSDVERAKGTPRGVWLYVWAWAMLAEGGHPSHPPAEVINGTDLHARSPECP